LASIDAAPGWLDTLGHRRRRYRGLRGLRNARWQPSRHSAASNSRSWLARGFEQRRFAAPLDGGLPRPALLWRPRRTLSPLAVDCPPRWAAALVYRWCANRKKPGYGGCSRSGPHLWRFRTLEVPVTTLFW